MFTNFVFTIWSTCSQPWGPWEPPRQSLCAMPNADLDRSLHAGGNHLEFCPTKKREMGCPKKHE